MKILWLYRYIREYDFDNWLHMKFAEYLSTYPDVQLVAYGPDLHHEYNKLVKLKYLPLLHLKDIYAELRPDVVILNTKSRMFNYYNPHKDEARDCWLPNDFKEFKQIPKIVLEEDYHYEKNDDWYRENGIDLILQRHFNSVKRQKTVPMEWLPFSVDHKTFFDRGMSRYLKVGLAGSSNSAYPERQSVSKFLKAHELIDIFCGKEKIGEEYLTCLNQYMCHLSCTSRYHITPAKMFEIMASGSIMLSNNDPHLRLLFKEGSYVTFDFSQFNFEQKMLKLIRDLINNEPMRKEIVQSAKEDILTRHTHDIRIRHLLNIISYLKAGKLYKETIF